jgi:hypothetical protein
VIPLPAQLWLVAGALSCHSTAGGLASRHTCTGNGIKGKAAGRICIGLSPCLRANSRAVSGAVLSPLPLGGVGERGLQRLELAEIGFRALTRGDFEREPVRGGANGSGLRFAVFSSGWIPLWYWPASKAVRQYQSGLQGMDVFVGWASFAHADRWAASCPPYPSWPSSGTNVTTDHSPVGRAEHRSLKRGSRRGLFERPKAASSAAAAFQARSAGNP